MPSGNSKCRFDHLFRRLFQISRHGQNSAHSAVRQIAVQPVRALNEHISLPKLERQAASILARARFLEELDKIEKTVKIPIAKGVNPVVEEAAKKIYFLGGIDKLKCFVKLHFKTTQKIIN